MAQLPSASCCEMRLEGSCMIGILGRANGSGREGWRGPRWSQCLDKLEAIVGGALSQRSPSLRVRVGPWICFQGKRLTLTTPPPHLNCCRLRHTVASSSAWGGHLLSGMHRAWKGGEVWEEEQQLRNLTNLKLSLRLTLGKSLNFSGSHLTHLWKK